MPKSEIKKIPIFKLEFDDEFVKKFQEGSAKILRSDFMSDASTVRQFEELFSRFISSNYSIAVNSGTAALDVAFRSVTKPGDRVVIPSNTFFATSLAAKSAKLDVVLCDIELDYFSLDPGKLEDILITENISCVCVVHIGGLVSPHIDLIVELCKKYNVVLIEDAAHAHGSVYMTKPAGTIGSLGCFSFFPTKVMTTAEGGMITCQTEELFKVCNSLKNFGRSYDDPRFCNYEGLNYKMTEFQALFGLLELERVSSRIVRRQYLASLYKKHIKNPIFKVIDYPYGECSFYKQIITIQDSDVDINDIRKFLKDNGIAPTGEVYRLPLHEQELFRDSSEKFPNTNWFCNHHFCPPLYPELKDEEIIYISDVLNGFKV